LATARRCHGNSAAPGLRRVCDSHVIATSKEVVASSLHGPISLRQQSQNVKRLKILFLLLLAVLIAGLLAFFHFPQRGGDSESEKTTKQDLAAEVRRLEAQEQHANETFWSKETLAEECGRTFETLWDEINRSTNKLSVVGAFNFGNLILANWAATMNGPHGIQIHHPSGPPKTLTAAEWPPFIEAFQMAGWKLETMEFRHNRFDVDEHGSPTESRFFFSAHLQNTREEERAIVEGDLVVQWGSKRPEDGLVQVKQINATALTIKTRRGPPPFKEILSQEIVPPERSSVIDPLIVYDLDGNGFPEIILAAKNLLFRRHGEDKYESEPLCRFPPEFLSAAIIADFDGDGSPDFLYHRYEGLYLYKGSPKGTFDERPRPVCSLTPNAPNSMALTCGDIDGDGDLDVFLAQYREPYEGGVTPQPFYDANDGYPSYLLLNDGHANFTDGTAAAGLTKKRLHRSYSASFVDLDQDGHLDLAVASDFAGLDLYRKDGRGHFTDVTQAWVPDSHAFGMAQTFGDFNADGRLDLLMIGMLSPTVERLEHLNLWRSDSSEDRSMRSRMTRGNRLYLAKPAGGFEETAMSDTIARSGWSWGASSFDLDNDGFPDVYIANGLESNASVRDYESEYWLHDNYVGATTNNTATDLFFKSKFSRTRGRDYSYGGYEKNRLYLNQGGTSFLEAGYLMGVALEEDCRNVVADDLDGDGRVDLVVTTFEIWPRHRQILHVYRNTLSNTGDWIGFRFPNSTTAKSPIGASVLLHYAGRTVVGSLLTGDSYRSQHSATVHFGLGSATRIDRVEIRRPTGNITNFYRVEPSTYQNLH
jgi:hypothetical protein